MAYDRDATAAANTASEQAESSVDHYHAARKHQQAALAIAASGPVLPEHETWRYEHHMRQADLHVQLAQTRLLATHGRLIDTNDADASSGMELRPWDSELDTAQRYTG